MMLARARLAQGAAEFDARLYRQGMGLGRQSAGRRLNHGLIMARAEQVGDGVGLGGRLSVLMH